MQRITNEDIGHAIRGYVMALQTTGFPVGEGEVVVGCPYGQCYYVYRYDNERHLPIHDLPAFMGSTGGFMSKREVHDALRLAARTLFDLDYWRKESARNA